ncbi:hypothetical protein PPTG_00003 [Phytophthora nicotianae INRA-310]|uniref:Uncharacterized protein n=2 Tax=Phytophthora nicotianae TaxID=4792 RepID=W2RFF2_PHYN3|nr:hypothetical protein PPTG_00003 [Phytophthora nicotianae INRA-310]ETN23389.1 hypothetical protein PPTG_00003 [Phytophthora nicotianae INRA-310]ETO86458.1 hypothetical protein F444_00001 [Phytophthora nicotianae P1976]
MLTFILNWIPNFGAMIESIAPICIIAITPSVLMNPMETFLAMFLSMCFHMFVGNFVEVKVFGKKEFHLKLWPEFVALVEGTYFTRLGNKVNRYKKEEDDQKRLRKHGSEERKRKGSSK